MNIRHRNILLIELKGGISHIDSSRLQDFCYVGPIVNNYLHVVPKVEYWRLLSYIMLNGIPIGDAFSLNVDNLCVYKVMGSGVVLPKFQLIGKDPLLIAPCCVIMSDDSSVLERILDSVKVYIRRIKIQKVDGFKFYLYLADDFRARLSIAKLFRKGHFLSILNKDSELKYLWIKVLCSKPYTHAIKPFLIFPYVLQGHYTGL